MRILSIGAGLGRGGTERALVTFSLAYRRLGHDVAVLAWQEGGHRQGALEREGIEVYLGGHDLRRALDAADAFNPDLIHVHRIGVARGVESAILRRLRTRHRRVLETNVFGRVDRSAAREYIDVHMHLSEWCLWRWRRWLGQRQDMPVGVVVPNPVDPEAFVPLAGDDREKLRSQLGIPPDAFLCGRVGQPSDSKWHAATFTAFRALATVDPRAHLLLRGLPSSMRRDLHSLPDPIRRRVIELPLVDTDRELVDTYSVLDGFLHASRIGESFGYVLVEAMLCGCPVVTASTPHMDNSQVEVVGHMTGGIVAASMHALPAALLCLRSNEALRDRLRPGLRDHVVSRFGAESVAALALRIGTLALESEDRSQLRRRLAETPACAPRAAYADIRALMRNTLGDPARLDVLWMRVRHQRQVQRLVDAHLIGRLNRSVRYAVDNPGSLPQAGRCAATGDAGLPGARRTAGTQVVVPSRVALLVNFIPPYRVSLFRELRARVHELRIFVSTHLEPNRQWPVQWDGLEVARQRTITINKRWRRPDGFDDQMVVHLPYDTLAQLWRFRPDVVISGELGLRSCLAAAYRRLRPDVRLLIWATLSERTERGRGTVRNLIRPLLFRQADAVFVNGASGGRYVMSQHVPPERIWEIPYTIDVGAFAREAIRPIDPAAPCSLLFVGLLIPRKGVLGLLTALARWAHAHPARAIEFRIAGDGPQRVALESVPTPPNLTMRLLGNVPYERLPDLYREATILVMPTLEDEWGVVINEGMAAGLPVLGSRYSQAVEELVTDGETGWTFTPDDEQSVNASLDLALTASAANLARMSRAARERAMRLTPSAVAERMAEAIDAIRRGRPNVRDGAFGPATQER